MGGEQPDVIHRHYKGLVKEADATEYWTVGPKTVKTEILNVAAQGCRLG